MIEATLEFPEKIKLDQIPKVTGELGNRWNRLFGSDRKDVLNHAEFLGLVETGRDYWQEVENNPKLLQPLWPKQAVKGESEWWARAAECLRMGEGDMEAIDHIRKFIVEKAKQEHRETDKQLEDRLGEIVTWLVDFQKNPRALPDWQEVDHGTPVVKYSR